MQYVLLILFLLIPNFSLAAKCPAKPPVCAYGEILYYFPDGGSCANAQMKCRKIGGVVSTNSPRTNPIYQSQSTILSKGSRGSVVLLFQQKLVSAGYLEADNATGYFGALTESAVRQFQTARRIVSSGTPTTTGYGAIGAKTRSALNAFESTLPAPTSSDNPEPVVQNGETITRTLTLGAQGSDVMTLQRFLTAQSLLSSDSVTGYFGRITQAAVIVFQQKNNLDPVGHVGRLTRDIINNKIQLTAAPISDSTADTPPENTSETNTEIPPENTTDVSTDILTVAPTLTITASVSPVVSGEGVTISWVSENADECTALGSWHGAQSPTGSQEFANLTAEQSYILTCTGAGGSVTKSVVVAVTQVADTIPPAVTGIGPTAILPVNTNTVSLTAITDESASCSYSLISGATFTSMTAFSSTGSTAHSNPLTGLVNGTSYTYYVSCKDGAGNVSPEATVSFSITPLPDTTSPVTSITVPIADATVSQTIIITATASDPASPQGQTTSGIAGVQFKINGSNLNIENTVAPYTVSWNTTTISNGTHRIDAVARDVAGNVATSTINVTVSNTYAPPSATPIAGTYASAQSVTLVSAGSTSIRYTTDNTVPSCTTGSLYTAPINITPTKTIKTIACYSGGQSSVASFAYTVPDIIAPSVPAGINAIATSSTQINLSWSASTDTGGAGLAGYKVFRNNAQIATTTLPAYQNTGLTASTTYLYAISAYDKSGNISARSATTTKSTLQQADITAPTVAITIPTTGAVTGIVNITATASDPSSPSGQATSGIVGVQFKIDNININAEDTIAPYTTSWNTATASNGSHRIDAVARDAVGNRATSTVMVTK